MNSTLCASLLKNRSQFIVYNGVKSKSFDCGVPQGSNVRPLFFIVYTCMSDIFNAWLFLFNILHPDDTSIFYQVETLKSLYEN